MDQVPLSALPGPLCLLPAAKYSEDQGTKYVDAPHEEKHMLPAGPVSLLLDKHHEKYNKYISCCETLTEPMANAVFYIASIIYHFMTR